MSRHHTFRAAAGHDDAAPEGLDGSGARIAMIDSTTFFGDAALVLRPGLIAHDAAGPVLR